jgi:putative ABC transport system substrate-binding protein
VKRREFITLLGGAAVARPLAARAQQTAKPVIGFLNLSSANNSVLIAGFGRGLAEVGYVDGRNVQIEYRWADGHYDRLSDLAADLIRRRVDVIAAGGTSAPGLVAKAATSTIPIVFQTGSDPVVDGLVASMNRSGGNITGVSRMTVTLDPKRLGLLHEVVPKAKVFGFLMHQNTPRPDSVIDQVQNAAQSLGVSLTIAKLSAESELERSFVTMSQQGADALLIESDPAMERWTNKIITLTAQHSMPAISNNRGYVLAGGFMSYDSSLGDSFRQVGVYVGRILKGEKPADLPVMQPTTFELVINLKTAKALGLTVPPTLLARADEVIE